MILTAMNANWMITENVGNLNQCNVYESKSATLSDMLSDNIQAWW